MRNALLALAMFSTTVWANCQQWTPWLQLNGEATTEDHWTRIDGEAFAPIYQCPDRSIGFLWGRAARWAEAEVTDVNAGGGYRHLFNGCFIGGVNVSYAGLNSCEERWYHYIDIGGELFWNCFDGHLNWRQPIGRRHRQLHDGPTLLETILVDDEVRAITQLEGDERSCWSIDGELGWRFCLSQICLNNCWFQHGRLYAGGQYCEENSHHRDEFEAYESHRHRCHDMSCAYFGAEVYNRELHFAPCGLQITAGARVCTDFNRDTAGIFYITLRKALCKSSLSPCDCNAHLLVRMDDPIYRRIRPCAKNRRGPIINEPLTTDEYPVDGIWVSYEADEDDLQVQIDKALANGGNNTMIFVDGKFVGDAFTLNPQQVLAGGNAFLNSRGRISGVPIPWGDWGNRTTNQATIMSSDPTSDLMTMGDRSVIDKAAFIGGLNTITNELGAMDLIIRRATVIANNDPEDPPATVAGIFLDGADRSLIEETSVLGGNFDRAGYWIANSDAVRMLDISSSNAGNGNIIQTSTNTLVNGMLSDDDGTGDNILNSNSWTNINSQDTTITNFFINTSNFDGISSGFSNTFPGVIPSNLTISDGIMTDSNSDGIFLGSNTGVTTIENVEIEVLGSMGFTGNNGIQLGGSGTSQASFVGIPENVVINQVTINSFDPGNSEAALLIQNRVLNGVQTISVNNSDFTGAAGTTVAFELRSEEATSVMNLSGDTNTVTNFGTNCVLLPAVPAGTINGNITFNGTEHCPP